MLYSRDEEKFFVQKPPVVEAYQFLDEDECVAQRRAEDFGNCTFHYWSTPHEFTFGHNRHMDWVDTTVRFEGKKLRRDQQDVTIPIGWWIVIDEIEDTVDFIPDHKFQARYEAQT